MHEIKSIINFPKYPFCPSVSLSTLNRLFLKPKTLARKLSLKNIWRKKISVHFSWNVSLPKFLVFNVIAKFVTLCMMLGAYMHFYLSINLHKLQWDKNGKKNLTNMDLSGFIVFGPKRSKMATNSPKIHPMHSPIEIQFNLVSFHM